MEGAAAAVGGTQHSHKPQPQITLKQPRGKTLVFEESLVPYAMLDRRYIHEKAKGIGPE